MTKISDQMKGGQGFGGSRPSSTPAPECSDMALAMTGAVQGQANQLVVAAQAAQVSIGHASDQLSDYFAEVMTGRALIEATLAKTAAKIEAQGGAINISTDVAPVTLNLPAFGDFGETRQRFRGLFNPAEAIDPSYILSTPANLNDGEHDA